MIRMAMLELVVLVGSSAYGQTARGRGSVSEPTSGDQTYCIEHGRVRQC